MYSPSANAGARSLLIWVTRPVTSTVCFTSSSASGLASSTARTTPPPAPLGEQGLLHARRMHGVAIDQQDTLSQMIASKPERVAVVR